MQLSFLSDENLTRVLFLSPPSCGKTVLKKAKVKNLGQKGEPVVFLLPCYNGIKPLLFFYLKREFETLNIEGIKVDTVKADFLLNIDEEDLMQKIENQYKGHHVFIDEVGIEEVKDIFLLKKVAQKLESLSFWVSVTYVKNQDLRKQLEFPESDFTIITDQLNVPLRNPKTIVAKAHNIGIFLVFMQ